MPSGPLPGNPYLATFNTTLQLDEPAERVNAKGRRVAFGAGVAGSIALVAVTDDRPVADQLAELGAQLAWVRDYL